MDWKWTVTIAMMMAIITETQRRNGYTVQEMDIQIDALSATCFVYVCVRACVYNSVFLCGCVLCNIH